jgi:hypothetical protein
MALNFGLPDGEWLLPVLAWTRPDGGDVRRPPALVLRAQHGAEGHVRLAPPDGWRDLDTFYAVDATLAGDQIVQLDLTIPGALLGAGTGSTATWELCPDADVPMRVSSAGAGSFVGTVAGDRATGSWSYAPEAGLKIEAHRDGARSVFSWRPRHDGGEVVGLDVVIHHQLGEMVGGMQIRLG